MKSLLVLWTISVSASLLAGPARAQGALPPGADPLAPPAVPSVALREPAVRLTLRDAIARARQGNRSIGTAQSQIAVAQAQRRNLVGSILPNIAATGGFIRNSTEESFGNGNDKQVVLPLTDWNYKITYNQPIYAGLREVKGLKQANLQIDSARHGFLSAEDQVIAAVVSDYLAVLEGDDLIRVERQNVELADRRHKQAQDLFEAGETTKVDALRAEADTRAAERRLAAARQNREGAVSRLRLDLALDAPIEVESAPDLFPALPSAESMIAEAEKSRPEVAQAQVAVEIAKLEIGKQSGAYLPIVTSDGGYVSQKSAFPAAHYGYVALRLTVPIYQGGTIAAKVAVAREQLRQADLHLQDLKQNVREEVRQALVDLTTATASLALSRDQLRAAQADYDQSAELYRAEELTALDLATAETSLADARRAVATSTLDRGLAELRVWAAAGLLKKAALPEGDR